MLLAYYLDYGEHALFIKDCGSSFPDCGFYCDIYFFDVSRISHKGVAWWFNNEWEHASRYYEFCSADLLFFPVPDPPVKRLRFTGCKRVRQHVPYHNIKHHLAKLTDLFNKEGLL